MGLCGSSTPPPPEMQTGKGDSIIMRATGDSQAAAELEISKGSSIMLSAKALDKDWKPGDPISYAPTLVRSKQAVIRAGAKNVRATYGYVVGLRRCMAQRSPDA